MTRAKKILVTVAVAMAAVGGTSASAFANTHVTVSPDNTHVTVSPDNTHVTVSPDNTHVTGAN